MRAQPVHAREALFALFSTDGVDFFGTLSRFERPYLQLRIRARLVARSYRRRRRWASVLLPLARVNLSRLRDAHQHELERPLWGLPKDADQSEQCEEVRQMQKRVVLLEGVSSLGLEASEQTGTQTPVRGFSRC